MHRCASHLAFAAGLACFTLAMTATRVLAAGGQPPCVYELLSLDVSSEHHIRLLRACAPKGAADALLLEALKRKQHLAARPPESNALEQFARWAGAAFRAVAWIAWPLTVLALAAVVRAAMTPLSRYVWRAPPPALAPPPGAEIAVARNVARSVSAQDRIDAGTAAGVLAQAYPNRARDAWTAAGPAADVATARRTLDAYFDGAQSAMLASQLSALTQRLTAQGQATLANLRAYYDRAAERGAGIGFREWVDYLDRHGLVTTADMAGADFMTPVALTVTGRCFVAWCDVKAITPQVVAANGRPF